MNQTQTVHFNHAGGSPAPDQVLDTITEHLRREARLGPMEAAATVTERMDALYRDTAELLGARPDEIAITGSQSHGWGMACAALDLQPGARILVSRQEWAGNLATLRHLAERVDAHIEIMPCDSSGQVDVEALAMRLDKRVSLIALTWLPANGGLINPAAAVGKLARAADIPYFIDAAQALGQLPTDVTELGCDVLTGAGRKYLRGPRGTGLLYVRREYLPQLQPVSRDVFAAPWTDGAPNLRQDARRFETSEASVALKLGLGTAIRHALDQGIPAIRERIDAMAHQVRAGLWEISGIRLHDLGEEHSGLVSFTVDGLSATDVRSQLAARGINVGVNGVSYTPFDMAARGLGDIVRASVSYTTTDEEVAQLLDAVATVAASSR